MSHPENSQTKNKNIIRLAFILTLIFTTVELICAYLFHSLSLFSEGFHMATDSLSLLLSLIAMAVGLKAATKTKSFGYRRFETLSALFNGVTLLVVPILVVKEAIYRMITRPEVIGSGMMKMAIFGLVVNIIVAFILSRGEKEESLNLRAAFLHVFADITSSIGVLIASLLIIHFHFYLADPIVSFIVSIVIFTGGVKVTKEAINVLMEGTPDDVNYEEIYKAIQKVDGIVEIKDVKLWSIASGENYCNLTVTSKKEQNEQDLLSSIQKSISSYQLHTTIQIEKHSS